MNTNNVHEGRNIKRFREMLGMKQEALALELGGDWTQRRVSLLEQKEQIEKDVLEEVAKVLKVPAEAFERFDDEQVVNIVTNTFSDFKDNAVASPVAMNYHCTFNPLDKVIELYEANKQLYERMLQEKDEAMARLEKLVEKLK